MAGLFNTQTTQNATGQSDEAVNLAVRLSDLRNQLDYGIDNRQRRQKAAQEFVSLGGEAKLNELMSVPAIADYMTVNSRPGGFAGLGDLWEGAAVMGGAMAAGGALGGSTLAGTSGGTAAGSGATAAGGGLTAEAAGSTAAMTPEAIAAAESAGYGTTGTAASVGLGTLAANSGGDSGTANTNTGNTSTISPNTLSSLIQGGTSLWAGQQGVNAANNATDELRRQFDIGQENTKPWLDAGKNALGAQQDLMGLGANGPEAQLSSLMNSPGYQFRLNQGRRNLEASSAARGGMGSGKAATAMNQYGQDYASNEYGNRLNQFAGLSGTGQTQANQNMNSGMNYAGEMGNASIMGANARQSGILGAGSALSNWLNPPKKELTLADLLRSQ